MTTLAMARHLGLRLGRGLVRLLACGLLPTALHAATPAVALYYGNALPLSDFRAFVARVRRDLPQTRIGYLAIKPSPSRADQLPRQQQANALIRAEAARMRQVVFIDVATPMLGADGQPRPELFLEDRLHMTRAGYALWRSIVAPYLP